MIGLVPRDVPLVIAGVHASGAAAIALARLLAKRSDAARRWSAVSSGDAIVVLGDELPWVDGVTWLGREPDAPELLVPTLSSVTPHAALVLAAIRKRSPNLLLPIALVPSPRGLNVISLGSARAPGGAPLEAFLEAAK